MLSFSTPTPLTTLSPEGNAAEMPAGKVAYIKEKPIYYPELTGIRCRQYWLKMGLLLLSLGSIVIAATLGRRLFGVPEVKMPVETKPQNVIRTDEQIKQENRRWLESEKKRRNRVRQLKLWIFVVSNIALVAFGFDQLRRVQ